MKTVSGNEDGPSVSNETARQTSEPIGLQVVAEPDPEEDSVFNHFGEKHVVMAHLQDTIAEGTQALHEILHGQKLDLLEVCAPWDSPSSGAVRELGGKAVSIGLHNGFDLSTRQGFLKAASVVRKTNPLYLHISPPCFPWSPLQNCNQNSAAQIETLREKRVVGRKKSNTVESCWSFRFLKTMEMEVQLFRVPT